MLEGAVSNTESLILNSRQFRSKPQMKRMLSYLIKHSYTGDYNALQQRAIALNCLGRNSVFDSAKDPIVRIEAARLRRLLNEYYDSPQAQQAALRVCLPRGSYQLAFSKHIEHRQSCGFHLLLLCQTPIRTNLDEHQLMLRLRLGLSHRLSHFEHFNLSVNFHPEHEAAQSGSVHFLGEEQYDYVMRLEIVQDRDGVFLVSSLVVHRLTQEILWSHSTSFSKKYTMAELNEFYLGLISPLIADSYGILGIHWAESCLERGLEFVEDQHMALVQFIILCNSPSREACIRLLDFLDIRLKKYPDDFNAQGYYLAVGIFDFFLNYQLVKASLSDRLGHCLLVSKQVPHSATVSVLIGSYYFVLDQYSSAELYLTNARKLNPYNTMWDFIYSGLLFFTERQEEGFGIISNLFKHNKYPPGYYYVPIFLSYLSKQECGQAFQVDPKMTFADNLEGLLRSARSRENTEEQNNELPSRKMSAKASINFSWLERALLMNCPELLVSFKQWCTPEPPK